jgi:hypothetical protein
VTITVDAGPASLATGSNPSYATNFPYVSVTLCVPGTTTCQTIDHIQLDTGSVGLRVEAAALNSTLQSALPHQTDPAGNGVGECYGYIDGYAFGSVRQADFSMAGESVGDMPLQIIGDGAPYTSVPSSCSSGGGDNLNTVALLAANGVLGVGTTPTDCGVYCTSAGGYSAAIYYDCPASGCSAIIGRSSTTSAPFQQLPNPVAAFAVDNNGVLVSLPAIAATGQATATGTLYFGIGTQSNNALGSATVLTTTLSTSTIGSGLITAVFNGQTLPDSFIDSGSGVYFFTDAGIPACTSTEATGFYCPPSTLTLNAVLQGQNGASASISFPLYSAQTLFNTGFSALPGIGGDTKAAGVSNPYPTSFDFGLPFFYGRPVYTGIEGRAAGAAQGPYYAF